MDKKLFKQYAELKAARDELDEKMSKINGKILEALVDARMDRYNAEFGVFSVVPRKTWKYSDKVNQTEVKLKQLKEKEQESGVAQFEESQSLRFTPSKDNEAKK